MYQEVMHGYLAALYQAYGPGDLTKQAAYLRIATKQDRDIEALGRPFCKLAWSFRQDPWQLAAQVAGRFDNIIKQAATTRGPAGDLARFYVDWGANIEKQALVFPGRFIRGAPVESIAKLVGKEAPRMIRGAPAELLGGVGSRGRQIASVGGTAGPLKPPLPAVPSRMAASEEMAALNRVAPAKPAATTATKATAGAPPARPPQQAAAAAPVQPTGSAPVSRGTSSTGQKSLPVSGVGAELPAAAAPTKRMATPEDLALLKAERAAKPSGFAAEMERDPAEIFQRRQLAAQQEAAANKMREAGAADSQALNKRLTAEEAAKKDPSSLTQKLMGGGLLAGGLLGAGALFGGLGGGGQQQQQQSVDYGGGYGYR